MAFSLRFSTAFIGMHGMNGAPLPSGTYLYRTQAEGAP